MRENNLRQLARQAFDQVDTNGNGAIGTISFSENALPLVVGRGLVTVYLNW